MSWSKSDSIAKLTEALAKVQADLKPVRRAGRADVVSKRTGAKFSYDYQTLQDVWEALRPLLAREGLAVLQPSTADGPRVGVTTILSHVSGEWLASTLWMEAGDTSPQSIGSCVSYARRYGLCSTTGVVADEDDDGQAAQPDRRPQGRARTAEVPTPSVQRRASPVPKPESSSAGELKATSANGHLHLISSQQRKRMFAIAHEHGWKDEEVKILLARHGFTSSKDITLIAYDSICKGLIEGVGSGSEVVQ